MRNFPRNVTGDINICWIQRHFKKQKLPQVRGDILANSVTLLDSSIPKLLRELITQIKGYVKKKRNMLNKSEQ